MITVCLEDNCISSYDESGSVVGTCYFEDHGDCWIVTKLEVDEKYKQTDLDGKMLECLRQLARADEARLVSVQAAYAV